MRFPTSTATGPGSWVGWGQAVAGSPTVPERAQRDEQSAGGQAASGQDASGRRTRPQQRRRNQDAGQRGQRPAGQVGSVGCTGSRPDGWPPGAHRETACVSPIARRCG